MFSHHTISSQSSFKPGTMFAYFLITLFGTAAIILAYVRFVTFSHWHNRGFPFLAPNLPWGNLESVMLRRTSFGMNIHELYARSKHRLVGVYLFWRPALLVRDPELIKRMLGADFEHFHDRGVYSRPLEDPISDNLFAMCGHRWRQLRAQLTPMFTSGRLKSMLPTMLEKGDNLVNALVPSAETDGTVVEMKDFVARYGLDSIASIFFGIDVDTIAHRRHEFRVIEKHTNNKHYLFNLVPMLIFLCPRFLQFIRLPSVPPRVKAFVMRLVTQQIRQREREHTMRKDFMQFLIQIRNSGQINADDSDWRLQNTTGDESTKCLSVEQCAAQVFLFYFAGFDTSASLAVYTLFEAGRNERVSSALYREIDEVLRKFDGELTYDGISEMKYLDLCVMETARKYPVLPLLNRVCTRDYRLPGSPMRIIESGTAIVISLMGLARDPQHFPDPLEYRPERFAGTPKHCADAYIPFGDGPRACIGVRLGKLMAKVCIVKLLQKYRFDAVTDAELDFDNFGITLHVKGGIPMRISKRAM